TPVNVVQPGVTHSARQERFPLLTTNYFQNAILAVRNRGFPGLFGVLKRSLLTKERKERELNPQGFRSAVFGTAAIAHWLALPYCLHLCQTFPRFAKYSRHLTSCHFKVYVFTRVSLLCCHTL